MYLHSRPRLMSCRRHLISMVKDIVLFHCSFLYTYTSLENLFSTLSQVSLSCIAILFHKTACQSFSALSLRISRSQDSRKPSIHKVQRPLPFLVIQSTQAYSKNLWGESNSNTRIERERKLYLLR